MGNPLAGIDPEELVDTRPLCNALDRYITNDWSANAEITNLPRKWNLCVVGTHDLFEHPHINDLAFMPAMKVSWGGGGGQRNDVVLVHAMIRDAHHD